MRGFGSNGPDGSAADPMAATSPRLVVIESIERRIADSIQVRASIEAVRLSGHPVSCITLGLSCAFGLVAARETLAVPWPLVRNERVAGTLPRSRTLTRDPMKVIASSGGDG